jgi:uncharacterized membrane protein
MEADVSDAGRGPTRPKASVPARAGSAKWVVAALILLSAIPLAAGAYRLSQLISGAQITPDNARFFAAPLPVVLHIVSVTVYALLGAFQFVPRLRRRRQSWHRNAGWILIPSGLIVALSGLWMTLVYRMPAYDGVLVYALRLLFGSAMLLSLILGVAALGRRDFAQHGSWMLRAYAIGMGAGTQVITGTVASLFVDPPTELSRALLMGAAWAINLAVAEWIIRRRATRSRAAAVGSRAS